MMPSDVLAGMVANAVASAELSSPASTSFTWVTENAKVTDHLCMQSSFWYHPLFAKTRYREMFVTRHGTTEVIYLSRSSSRIIGRALARRYSLCQEYTRNERKYRQEKMVMTVVEEKLK